MRGNLMLPFMVFFPMIGAIVSYIIGRFSKSARNTAVLAVCALELALLRRGVAALTIPWKG